MKELHDQRFTSVAEIEREFSNAGYICNREIATAIYIAFNLHKPILVEGPAGVGKTELAKTTASILDVPLIRLQCYEGLDESKALYEWKYGKQLLYTQLLKDKLNELLGTTHSLTEAMGKLRQQDDLFFSEEFLEPRPLFKALHEERGCVLLVDEVDKSDHEFEAFLLEVLSDFQVSIPEIGTIVAKRQADRLSDQQQQPGDERRTEAAVPAPEHPLPRTRAGAADSRKPGPGPLRAGCASNLVSFVHLVRALDLKKLPSISETIDWARVLVLMHAESLEPKLVQETLNTILKFQDDIEAVNEQLDALIADSEQPMAKTGG
jgi:hypothetical protein